MTESLAHQMKSVVLLSDAPDTVAAFYRDVLGVPLERERHRGTDHHFAAQLGDFHFAIHPREGFWLDAPASTEPSATIVSFTVADLEGLAARLEERGVPVVARHRVGPMHFLAVRDPDGRQVCCGTPWPGD